MVCDSYNNCLLSHFNGQKNIHCTTVFAIIESEVCVSGTDVHLRFDFIHKYIFFQCTGYLLYEDTQSDENIHAFFLPCQRIHHKSYIQR